MRRIQPRILSSVSFATLAIVGLPTVAFAQPGTSPADCSTYPTAQEREACLARQSEDAGQLPSATPSERDEAIVITGSRIRSDVNSSEPVTIINTDVAFQEGQNQTAEMIQSAPIAAGSLQITGAISNNFVTNGGADAQTISLRGLGAERTLVLLNGRRAGPAGVRGSIASFDLNVVPQSIVQSVEILKTGASSIYGSDAIAGVVNILTRRNTDGIEFRGTVSIPEHSGGETYNASLTYGRDFGNAHFLISGDYFRQNNLRANQREFLDCQEDFLFFEGTDERADIVDARTGQPSCGGVIGNLFLINNQFLGAGFNQQLLSGPARFNQQLFIGQFSVPGNDISGACLPIDPYPNVSAPANFFGCNFDGPSTGVLNQYLPLEQNSDIFSQVERYTAYAQGGVEITPSIEIFFEGLYNKRKTFNNGFQQFGFFQFTGGSGVTGRPALPAFFCDPSPGGDFNCRTTDAGDPFNSEIQGNFLLQPLALTESDSGTNIDYYRGVLGARGDFGDSLAGWYWDIHGQYSRSEGDYFQDVIFADSIYTQAFRTRSCVGLVTPVRGVPCIDLDFTNAAGGGPLAGEFTPEQQAFLFGEETGHTTYEQLSGEATVSGTLFTLPAGEVGLAAGVQIRRDEINDVPGEHTLAGNVYGRTSSGITAGSTLSKEVFGELQVPLLHNLRAIQEFTLTAAARYTDVDATRSDGAEDSFGDTTWKLGFNWQVTDFLRFRGSWGTSFRAPALFELFIQNQTGFQQQQAIDICLNRATRLAQGTINQRIFDNCGAAGIPPAFVGATGSAVISSSGGLGSLEPENSTAKTLGVVLTPDTSTWLWGGLSASFTIDYFDITVQDEITQLGAANIVRGCYNSQFYPNEPLCALITRATTGPGALNIIAVSNPYINVANQTNTGIDFTAQMRQDMGRWGTLSLLAQMTWQISDTIELFPGTETNINGEAGEPIWVGDFNLTWAKGDYSLFYGLDVIGGTDDTQDFRDANAGAVCRTSLFRPGVPLDQAVLGGRRRFCPDVRLSATDYHTISLTRRFGDRLQATIGVRNLFDAQPPRASVAFSGIGAIGQSPVFASQYDYLGRRFFFNLRASY
jgi:iron complex outermembrane recepter protein